MPDDIPTQPLVVVMAFPGLVLDVDPHDVEPGQAVEQENVMSDRKGMLRTRPGLRRVEFDS
jgi:hypothetical protein